MYGDRDPATIPAYSVSEIAHNLQLPRSTVRNWALGREASSSPPQHGFKPVILIASRAAQLLSFQNLVELHVLSAIRRNHDVKLPAVRKAVTYLRKSLHTDHPLSDRQMLTDGKDLFIEQYGELINASQDGQMEMKLVLEAYLRRIERDPAGSPVKLYPFTRSHLPDDVRPVSIDPRVSFGRPCLAGTGIPTAVIMERYKAGDTIGLLAVDYRRAPDEIEEAIRYEAA